MSKVLIWDLPTRLIHWLLAVGILLTFAIAQLAGEHSKLFVVHMLIGIVIGFVVLLRLIWGFIGTRYARFSSFIFGPSAVLRYLKEALNATGERFIGHNPGSSCSIFAMLLLTCTTVITGLLASNGSEPAEELHGVSAYTLLAVIAIHILGVAWHTIRHRENITLGMLTGMKAGSPSDAIRSSRPVAAVVFAAAIVLLGVGLWRNYDTAKGQTKLPVIGTAIQLERIEHGRNGSVGNRD